MNLKSLRKKLVLGGLAVSTTALIAGAAVAQNDPQAVTVSLVTTSALTSGTPQDSSFGEWLIIVRSTETILLTMDNAGDVVASGDTNSSVIEIDDTGAQTGLVQITTPTGIDGEDLQMTHGGITDFTDAGLSLTSILYTDTVTTSGNFTAGTAVPVRVVTGGTQEDVTLAHVISATITPADATHTASYTVSFAY